MEPIFPIALGAILVLLGIVLIFSAFYTVPQQHTAIVERFGKFSRLSNAGLNFKIPIIERIVQVWSLQVLQLMDKVETKTKDNVFVYIEITVQYLTKSEKVQQAYYSLDKYQVQMAAHIQEAARKIATALTLDEIFESKEEIRKAVTDELKDMETFGFDIHKVLVTNLTPDQRVMDAMNQINASNRLLEATKNQAEAEKIKMVKAAEAEKESKKLQGEGSAGQQMAIAEGRRQSIEIIKKAAPNADDTQILELTLMTQYIDMLREIGKKGDVIFVPYNPAAMSSGLDQIRDVVLATTKKQGTPSVSSR